MEIAIAAVSRQATVFLYSFMLQIPPVMCFKASQVRFLGLWYRIKKALSSIVGSFGNVTKSCEKFRCFDENGVWLFLLRGMIWNALSPEAAW